MMQAYWGLVKDQLSRMPEEEFNAAMWMFSQLWVREYQRRYSPAPLVLAEPPGERHFIHLVQRELLTKLAPPDKPLPRRKNGNK